MAEPYLWRHEEFETYYVMWQAEGGVTRRRSLETKDRRIALIRLREFIRDIYSGSVSPAVAKGRLNFFAYCDEFLDNHARTRTRETTVKLYQEALAKAKASWGDIPLHSITTRHVDAFMAGMIRAGLMPATVNKNFRHVRTALNKAFHWGYLEKPIRFPSQLSEEQKSRFLTIAQLDQLIKAVPDPELADFIIAAAYTGLRSGELLALEWGDVDNPEGFLRVTSKQKGKKENRIPISAKFYEVLGRCRARHGKRVFRWHNVTTMSHLVKKAIRKAGLPESMHLHDMRHTFGSHLAMSGYNEKTIQDLMRHASMASTIVYTKLSPEHLRKASESIDYGPLGTEEKDTTK
jgi:integrase